MLVITIAYKSALVVLGLVFLCFKFDFLCDCVGGMGWLLILGFTLNIACIIAFALVFFKPALARKLCIRLVNFLTWVKLIKSKNSQKYVIKIKKICDNYTAGAEYMKENLHTVLNVFLITVVQRMFLFAVTWVVYKAYGLSGTSFLSIIAVQIMIAISVEMLPLPGAAGVTEGCFLYMFSGLFGEELVKPALLLSRGLTFYAVLVVGGIVTLATHILSINTEKEDEEI
jgi:hypothetical protein